MDDFVVPHLLVVNPQLAYSSAASEQTISNLKWLAAAVRPAVVTRFHNRSWSLRERGLGDVSMRNTKETALLPGLGFESIPVYTLFKYADLGEALLARLKRHKAVVLCGADSAGAMLAIAFKLFDEGIVPLLVADASWALSGAESHQAATAVFKSQFTPDSILDTETAIAAYRRAARFQ